MIVFERSKLVAVFALIDSIFAVKVGSVGKVLAPKVPEGQLDVDAKGEYFSYHPFKAIGETHLRVEENYCAF